MKKKIKKYKNTYKKKDLLENLNMSLLKFNFGMIYMIPKM